MLEALGIIAFVLAILFSIAWHELGHLLPAKKFGVKVTQYMIGFGPTLWSRKRGETEYGIKGIPFGGYIRMIGMFPPGPDGKIKASSTGRFAAMIEDARSQSQEEILTEEDRNRTFYRLSVPKRLVVMLGGPVMNLILAFVLFTILLVGLGTPGASLTVAQVSPCTPTLSQPAGQCGEGSTPSPAAQAGLQSGDEIVSFNGQPVESWEQFSSSIRQAPAGPAAIGIVRNDQPMTLDTDIQVVTRAVVGPDGQLTEQTAPQGFFGMTPVRVLQPQPISEVPTAMWDLTVRTGQAMIAIPSKLVGVFQAAFGGQERDPNGPVGVVGVSRISGEVVAAENVPANWKVAQFVGLVASLNLFLFLFNLLPLLPLDGGHVAGALWEGARRQLARLRHRPDPGPVDVAKALPLAYAVAFILIGMSALLLYADVVNPIRLAG